jgi:hypothetical protein
MEVRPSPQRSAYPFPRTWRSGVSLTQQLCSNQNQSEMDVATSAGLDSFQRLSAPWRGPSGGHGISRRIGHRHVAPFGYLRTPAPSSSSGLRRTARASPGGAAISQSALSNASHRNATNVIHLSLGPVEQARIYDHHAETI